MSSLKKQLKAHFLLSLITEGPIGIVPLFIIPMKSIYSKILYFNDQKCIFEHCDIVSSLKTQMKAGFLIGIDNRGTHWYCNLIYNTNEINLQQKHVFLLIFLSSLKTHVKSGFFIVIDYRGTHWYCTPIYNTNEINLQQNLVF